MTLCATKIERSRGMVSDAGSKSGSKYACSSMMAVVRDQEGGRTQGQRKGGACLYVAVQNKDKRMFVAESDGGMFSCLHQSQATVGQSFDASVT